MSAKPAIRRNLLTDKRNDILNRGFFLVRNFLSSADISLLRANYHRSKKLAHGNAYTVGIVDDVDIKSFSSSILKVIEEMCSEGEFSVNTIGASWFFAIENDINLSWHQDHDSYYVNQSHWNYINLYIPIIKPIREKTNLSIIPADNFKRLAPDLWIKLEGRGASRMVERQGKTFIRDDHRGGFLGVLSCKISDIAETPALNEGDALFMRGDLFHRTQDTETPRVAVSIRIWNKDDIVTRAHFLTTCATKERIKQWDPDLYTNVGNAFAEKNQMTLGELIQSLPSRRHRIVASIN